MTEQRATGGRVEEPALSPKIRLLGKALAAPRLPQTGVDVSARETRVLPTHLDLGRRARVALGGTAVVAGLGLWQLLASTRILNPLFSSSPSGVAKAFWEQVNSGTLGDAVKITAETFFEGFVIALVIGFALGILIGWYPALRAILDPFVSLAYAAPRVALVPLIAVWFGIGSVSQIIVVILTAVFPIVINVAAGIKATDRDLIEMAQSYRGSNVRVLATVAMPGALPHFVSGIRQGLSQALIGVVVAEYLIGDNGIGGLIVNSGQNLEPGPVFVGVLIVAFAGLIMTTLLRMAERHYDHWRG